MQWTVELGPVVLGMVPKDGPGTAVHSCGACWWAGLLTTASKEDIVDKVRILWAKILLQRARHEWRIAQKILLQCTTGKSHIGELAPMA